MLHYTDANLLSATGPGKTAFTVRVNGAINTVTAAVVNAAAKTVTLALTTAVASGQVVTVSYTDPSNRNDDHAIQDAAGNDAASFTSRPVTNITQDNTQDTTPPVLARATLSGTRLVLHFTDNADLGATGPGKAAFTVRVGDAAIALSGEPVVNAAAKTVTLTLAAAVAPRQVVTVSYTEPSAEDDIHAIQDAAGNDAGNFSTTIITSPLVEDTTPPVLVTTGENAPSVSGTRLVLHYTDDSNRLSAAGPEGTAFRLRVKDNDGRFVDFVDVVDNVVVDPVAKTVILTLRITVTPGQEVFVSYTDQPAVNNSNAIQDAAGNDAPGFTLQSVINNSTAPLPPPAGDTTPPVLVTTGADAPRVISGRELVLHFTDSANLGATGPGKAAFTVRVGDATIALSGEPVVNATDKTVTLTLDSSVAPGQTVTVNYTDPSADNDSSAIQDAAGNDALSFSTTIVLPPEPDPRPPVLVTTGADAPRVSGRQVVLHFIDANYLHATGPLADAFTVRVAGAVVAVTGVAVNAADKTVTLTLGTAATPGQTVIVGYTDPTASNDTNAIQDAAGNDAISFSTTIVLPPAADTTPPVLVTTGADAPRVSGQQVVLHFSDANHLHTTGPLADAFTVLVDGAEVAVTGVAVNAAAQSVTLTLGTAPTPGQTVIVGYTDPSAIDDPNAIQDAADNDAPSFSTTIVLPPAPDTTPPVLVTTGADAPRVSGRQVVLHFTDTNSLSATGPLADAFTVRVDGAVVAVTGVVVVNAADKSVTLTLDTAATPGQTVIVGYTDPTPNLDDPKAIQDAAGNDAPSFSATIVLPPAPDSTPPVLVTTGADAPRLSGRQVVLHFTDANHLHATGPLADAFTVRVDGAVVAVTGIAVNAAAQSVTLTLGTAATPGQTVTVGYTDPSAGDDLNAIQDAAGNDAIGFSTTIVLPPEPDTTPPALVTTGADAPRVSGRQVVLHFTDANHLHATGPLADAFTVRVDGVVVAVTGVAVNAAAQSVTLTLGTAPTPGQTVIVGYTDPTPNLDDNNAIQDAAGNDAHSFSTTIVLQRPTEPDPVTPTTPVTPDTPTTPVTPSTPPTKVTPSTPPTTVTPSPTPATPPSSPRTLAPDDNDSVPGIEEDKIPGITGPGGAAPLAGDGNGDGIKDSQQSAVASMNGMTLVADSHDGKPPAGSSVRITAMEQQAAPANLPKGLEMPMGLLRFETALAAAAGSPESFSLYVDPTRGVNGYWVRDGSGVWVNLASETYGGKTVTEGGRLRLDFKITDGGAFDADGKADGLITTLGAAGHAQLSIVGQTHDQEHLGFWF